jgi:cell division protein FtsL
MNRYKEIKKETPKSEKKNSSRKPSRVAKSFIDVLNGNVLTKDYVVTNLPFIGFLTAIMLVYIGMGYYADRNARKIEKIESEILEANSEVVSLKTELNMISSPEQIADSTRAMGLQESADFPPRVIRVKEKVLKEIY